MKKLSLKLITLMLALVLIMTAFTACGSSDEDTVGEGITLTDMTGEEVTLEAPAEKVVAITASDCEIVYALGAGNTVVGRGEYCDYPEEALAVTAVKSGADTNIEEIIALEPNLVVMSTMAQDEEQVKALKDAGIAVYVSNASDIEGTYENIEKIGVLIGKTDEATAIVTDMKDRFAAIEEKVEAADPAKTVYFEVSPLQYGLWVGGADTFMDEIAAMMGLENAFSDVVGWGEISEEQVLERNPDIIVTTTMYFGEGPTPVEELTGRTGWDNITAVKEEMVYNADSNMITRPGPRLADAAEELYSFIYE